MKALKFSLLFILVIVLNSCEKEKSENSTFNYQEHGLFIVNEGSYGSNNGSISYKHLPEGDVLPDLFKYMSGVALGDVVQSMNIYNGKGYMVVNNSQKIEVVNMSDFHTAGTITGFFGPRYMLPISGDKAYVSDWFSNQVKVVDLNTLAVMSSINVGSGPEQMTISNNKVYVANVGGFGNDSTVSVIDVNTNSVIKTIPTGLNPNSVLTLPNGKIMVLCGGTTGPDYIGATADDIAGQLMIINSDLDEVENTLLFPQAFHPVKLASSKNSGKIYFLGGNDAYTGMVYEIAADFNSIIPFIQGNYYGLGINPADGYIYCGRPGFSAKCYFLRFRANGSLVDSSLAGIGPNGFVFN